MPLDLELIGINAGYGEMPALFGVSMAVPKGSVTALLGPNGAGKTTSLRVATGIVRPRSGQVRFKGTDVSRVGIRNLAGRGLCMIPEGRGIFPTLSVKENLLIQTHLSGRKSAGAVQDRAYEQFPILGERRNQVAGTLSGGEQQMLALSRVLTTDPSVVLLDEISMGLAPLIVEQLFGVVRQLAADGMTILLVEQLVQDALDIADYVFVLNQGRLRAVGEPDDVRNLLVRSYLGESESGPDTEALHDTLPLTPHGNGVTDAAGPDTMVKTAKGSRAHQRTCVIARMAADLRPVTDRDALEPCGLCSDVALPAAETSPATSR